MLAWWLIGGWWFICLVLCHLRLQCFSLFSCSLSWLNHIIFIRLPWNWMGLYKQAILTLKHEALYWNIHSLINIVKSEIWKYSGNEVSTFITKVTLGCLDPSNMTYYISRGVVPPPPLRFSLIIGGRHIAIATSYHSDYGQYSNMW